MFVKGAEPGAAARSSRTRANATSSRRRSRGRRARGRARRGAALGRGHAVSADVLARWLRVSGDLPQPMSGLGRGVADDGARTWTDEQRRAIERRDGDLLLDAGAGSGKTSVLVERFARAVIEDGIDVSAMLAITFTEKAAGRAARADPRAPARARRDRRRRARPRGRSSRRSMASARGCCAPARSPPGSTRRSSCSTSIRPSPLAIAAFDEALADLAGAGCRGGAIWSRTTAPVRCGRRPGRSTRNCAAAASACRGCRPRRRDPGPEARRELARAAAGCRRRARGDRRAERQGPRGAGPARALH